MAAREKELRGAKSEKGAMQEITIYGDRISGNCDKVRFIAERLGIPYHWIETSVLKAETRTPEFLTLNPAGQVVLADGRALAQSNAILLYLAEGSDLLPTDPYERALVHQWLFWEQNTHETAIAVRRYRKKYLEKPEAEIDESLKPKGEPGLSVMEQHLQSGSFFVGDRLTVADIALVAYTRMAHEGGFDLNDWPAVLRWVRRVEMELELSHLVGG
jgi:glutathione S-transferase